MFGKKMDSEGMLCVGLYTVFDRVANEAGPIFAAKNDAVAVRAARNLMDQDSIVREEEYQLYKVGNYYPEEVRVEGMEKMRIDVPTAHIEVTRLGIGKDGN